MQVRCRTHNSPSAEGSATPLHTMSCCLISILILFYLPLCFPSVSFVRFCPSKHCMHFSSTPDSPRCIPSPSHPPWFDHPQNIRCTISTKTPLLSPKFSLPCCYFLSPRPEQPPQCPILENPRSVFFPWCDRPSFTPTQNNIKYYSVHFLVFISPDSKADDTTVCTERTTRQSAPNGRWPSDISTCCSLFLHARNFEVLVSFPNVSVFPKY